MSASQGSSGDCLIYRNSFVFCQTPSSWPCTLRLDLQPPTPMKCHMDFFVCLAPSCLALGSFSSQIFFFCLSLPECCPVFPLAGGDHGVLETVLLGLPLELPTRQKASWNELSEGLAHLFPPLLDHSRSFLCLISVNSFSELIWFPSCL